MLITRGADLTIKNSNGQTAHDIAEQGGNPEIAQLISTNLNKESPNTILRHKEAKSLKGNKVKEL